MNGNDFALNCVSFLLPSSVDSENDGRQEQPTLVQEGVSFVLDVVPIVGQAKGLWQLVSGRDLVTGEEVNRAVELVGLLPMGKLFTKGGRATMKVFMRKAPVVGKLMQKSDMLRMVKELKLPRNLYDVGRYSPKEIAEIEAQFAMKQKWLAKAIKRGEARLVDMTKELRREANKATNERSVVDIRLLTFFREQKNTIYCIYFMKSSEKAARKYRDVLQRQYKNDPEILARLKRGDIDHMLDVQFGGKTGQAAAARRRITRSSSVATVDASTLC